MLCERMSPKNASASPDQTDSTVRPMLMRGTDGCAHEGYKTSLHKNRVMIYYACIAQRAAVRRRDPPRAGER